MSDEERDSYWIKMIKENFEKEYNQVLSHRAKCQKWRDRKLCADCFGGGLNKFTKKIVGFEVL